MKVVIKVSVAGQKAFVIVGAKRKSYMIFRGCHLEVRFRLEEGLVL